jgi:hypothetical protein
MVFGRFGCTDFGIFDRIQHQASTQAPLTGLAENLLAQRLIFFADFIQAMLNTMHRSVLKGSLN